MKSRPQIPSDLPTGLRYRAFLSYRTADRRLAEKLHRALETYRVPRSLVGTQGERGPIPARLGPIFRDRDDARTAADIESVIAHELGRSQHLVVLCTPRAAEPESWVPREIEIFRECRPDGEIHAVIGEGSPPNCFPAPLLKRGASGRLEVPLAADLRSSREGGQDGPRKAVVKVVAGLLGIPFDDLWRREARRVRLRRLLVASSLFAIAGAIGTGYEVERHSFFVREEKGSLVVWEGRPGLNLPGFPRRLWTLDQPAGSLILPEGTQVTRSVVAVGPGEDLLPRLRRLTRADYLAAQQVGIGRRDLARATALRGLATPGAPSEQLLGSWQVLAQVATGRDEPLFRELLRDERQVFRVAAVRALLRLNPPLALRGLSEMRGREREWTLADLIHRMEGPCSSQHLNLLESSLRSQSSSPSDEQIVDAAMRAGCRLGIESLVVGAQRLRWDSPPAVAGYSRWLQQEAPFSRRLTEELARADLGVGQRADFSLVLSMLDNAPCTPALWQGLRSDSEWTQLTSMAAVAKRCPGSALEIAWNLDQKAFEVSLFQSGEENRTLRIRPADSGETFLVLRLLGPPTRFDHAKLVPVFRSLLADPEYRFLRVALIERLTAIRDLAPLPRELVDDDQAARGPAIEHRRLSDERGVVALLLDRLGSEDSLETELGRIPLRASELKRVGEMLELAVDSEHRRQASCVLAMQESQKTVLGLLTSPNREVRQRAAECAPFNRDAAAIAQQLPSSARGFPIERYSSFRTEVRRKVAFERELAQVAPDLQIWRLALAERAFTYWGPWNDGMRAWLSEQRYRLSTAGDPFKAPDDLHSPRAGE